MGNGNDSQIDIGVVMTANTGAGASQAVADVDKVKAAETSAAAATGEAAAVDERASEIMREYGLTAQQMAQALELLGPAASTAAVGSAELEAAVETVQRATAAMSTEQANANAIMAEYPVSAGAAARTLVILNQAQQQFVLGSAEMEAALDIAQAEMRVVSAAQQAYTESMRQSEAELRQQLAAMDTATASTSELGVMSDTVAAALQRLSISEQAVTATATKMGVSLDIAARAMIQIKNAQTAADVAAVKAALEEQAAAEVAVAEGSTAAAVASEEAGAATVASFGRGSPGFHALVAAEEISRGGAIAMRGWMEYANLASVAVGGILGPALAVAAVIGIIVAKYEEHNEKVGEGKGGVDELAKSVDKSTDAWIKNAEAIGNVHLEVLTKQLREYLSVQNEIVANQDRLDSSANQRLTNLQNETKATQELALAQLRHQEQLDLNAATSDEQKAVITADYRRRETTLKGGDEQEANLAEQTLLKAQEQQNDAKRTQMVQDNIDRQQRLKDLQDDAASKADKAQSEGFTPREDGSFEDQIKKQTDVVKRAAEEQAKAMADAKEAGDARMRQHTLADLGAPHGYLAIVDQHAANTQAHANFAEQEYQDQLRRLKDIQDAQTSRETLDKEGKPLEEAMKANTAEINKLVSALHDIWSKQSVLSTQSKTAATENATEQAANDASASKAKSQLNWKAWQDAEKDSEKTHRAENKAANDLQYAENTAEFAHDRADEAALSSLKQQESRLKQQATAAAKNKNGLEVVAAVERLGALALQIQQAQGVVDADHKRRIQKAQDDANKALDLVKSRGNNAHN